MNDWFLIAERYGWTPDEVNALPLEFAEALPHMIRAYEDAQNRHAARAQNTAAASAAGQAGRRAGRRPGSMAG